MAEYNGWRNYETWRVNLEFAADHLDSLIGDGATFDSIEDLTAYTRETVEAFVAESCDGIAEGWVLNWLQDVDWRQIASHYEADLVRG